MALLGLASCTNDFLEEEMVSTITQEYFDSPEGVKQLVNGLYEGIRWKYEWENGPYLFHEGTDAEIKGSNDNDRYTSTVYSSTTGKSAHLATFLGQNSTGTGRTGMYWVINNANRAIYNLREGVVDLGDETDQWLSEALFIRAFCYYLLVTQFGEVPLQTEYTTSLPGTFYFPKASSEEIYRMLISDLRYVFENQRSAGDIGASDERNERITSGAAAHLLAKLYLQRAQGAEFQGNSEPSLAALYKGNVATDLDSCIYYSSQVIGSGDYTLASNYADLFEIQKGAWPAENNREIILSAAFSTVNNGPFNMRFHAYQTANYTEGSGAWGIPSRTWEYGMTAVGFRFSDWAFDVFTDKMADSRFEKSFKLEYLPMITDGTAGPDIPYYAYNNGDNKTQVWTTQTATFFNTNIQPTYDRASWGGRAAVSGQHKIGTGDLGLVFLENTEDTPISIDEAMAQPYVLFPRWVTDGTNLYYRVNSFDNFLIIHRGLDAGYPRAPGMRKFTDPNRAGLTSENGTRNVSIFRLAETYLIRAEAYGRKGDFGSAIADINTVRSRAAYKPGETRAEVLVRLYPGSGTLAAGERQWPYDVATDKTADMQIDASYWDGASAASQAENYPATATTELQRFVHFIYNELTREAVGEMILYEGIHHAGIQYDRIQYHQQMGSKIDGIWPVAANVSAEGLGQNGRGKGQMEPFHTFRPWPQDYLNMMMNEDGSMLDDAGKAAYQNPGY